MQAFLIAILPFQKFTNFEPTSWFSHRKPISQNKTHDFMTAKIVIMCETEKMFSVITANAPRLNRSILFNWK